MLLLIAEPALRQNGEQEVAIERWASTEITLSVLWNAAFLVFLATTTRAWIIAADTPWFLLLASVFPLFIGLTSVNVDAFMILAIDFTHDFVALLLH